MPVETRKEKCLLKANPDLSSCTYIFSLGLPCSGGPKRGLAACVFPHQSIKYVLNAKCAFQGHYVDLWQCLKGFGATKQLWITRKYKCGNFISDFPNIVTIEKETSDFL